MKNSELLAASNDSLLSGLDKQRRYVLQMHSQRMPCPNCGELHNVFEATGVDVDDYPIDGGGEKTGRCRKCKRSLIYVLPLMGGWHWRLDHNEG